MDWNDLLKTILAAMVFSLLAWLLAGNNVALIFGLFIIYLELRYSKLSKGGRK